MLVYICDLRAVKGIPSGDGPCVQRSVGPRTVVGTEGRSGKLPCVKVSVYSHLNVHDCGGESP